MSADRHFRALLAILGLAASSCAVPVPVPTYEVVRRDFRQRVTAEGFLVARDATQIVVPSQVRHGGRILWMEEDGSVVEEGQAVLRLDHYEVEQLLEAEMTELQSADAERRRTSVEGRSSVDAAITRKDVASLELDLAQRFRRDDASVFSRSEIIDSQIQEELARTRQGRATELEGIQGERARARVERVDVQRELASLEVALARAALSSLELRAPRSGILIWSRDNRGETARIGDEVSRGEALAEIPDLSAFEAEVFVLEADVAGIDAGLSAHVTIDAHPERSFEGTVARVDPIAKRRFTGSPSQYIGVTLRIENADPELMKPGQRVTASILVGEEPDALVLPRLALFADEDGYFVHVSRGGAFVRRQVTVRRVAPGLALIANGIEEGDVVALAEPATGRAAGTAGVPGARSAPEAASAAGAASAAAGR